METNISKLLQLEHNCRNCESLKELYYQVVNETRSLDNYELDLKSKKVGVLVS
ncbi:MAG: hypothetical protein PHY66_11870 [Aliarcobacter sp.]|nr:hypothetical protein [Aliarcobacter sp.]